MTMKTERMTVEEMTIMQEYVLIPHMLTMVNNAIDDLKHSKGFMNPLYLVAAYRLYDLIERDRKRLRREMDRRRISIMPDDQRDMVIYHKVICRGYEERFGVIREVMRSRIRVKMTEYMEKIDKMLSRLAT